ncbi:hypothetical protein J1N35_014312 [Gossypium stocksii]|uniref:C3H1-type domain-containing protein n=1 Tax=Gossypium stocksii TaxID=47602 RepID=A0A9D3VVT9_9ROSI|nr:hypothetical protein J1N35_014312 [Gossypium stocksii]
MSKSRKCSSKWDLKEERQYSLENVQDSARFANACDRESEHGSFSPEFGNKWSAIKSKHGLPSKESLHGSKCGENNSDCATNWKTTTPCDGEETYSIKKSPTPDDRRQQNRHHSLKSDWSRSQRSRSRSRSRGRSPVHGIGRQPGFLEKTRNGSGVSTQICKKFMAGRCRRGSQCHFLHQDIQGHEDGWDNSQKRASVSKYITRNEDKYYLIETGRSTDYQNGNCRRGASCRSAHDGVSDGFSKGSINEISREREKRNKLTSPERDVEREARKSSSIPCKYFCTGNCHNGNYCRFSHPASTECDRSQWGRSSASSDKLLDGAELTDVDASFNVEKYGNASNGSDADVSYGSEIPWTGPKWSAADASIDLHNSWAGSKQSDTSVYLGASKLNKDTNEFSSNMDEGWQDGYDVCGKNSESNVHCKRIDIDKEDLKKIENVGVNAGVSEPKGAEESIVAMEMSPMWNYRIHSSVDMEKSHSSEPTPVGTSLRAHGKNIIEKASGYAQNELAASQLMSTEESNFYLDHMTRGSSCAVLRSFDHPGPSSISVPYSNLNTVRQSELSFPSNEVNIKVPQNNLLLQEEKPSNKLNIGDTNILHGNYGFPSTQNMVTSFANSRGPAESGQEITFPEQYNPRSDSIDPAKKQGTNTEPLGFSVHPVSQESTADGKLELSAKNFLPSYLVGGRNGSDYHNDHSSKRESHFDSRRPNQLEPIASFELTKENGGIVQTKKAEAENKNGLSENTDTDDRTEEGKNSKDGKGVRAFKFALVEFVKDLLKPTWKEGQISKEAYKSIVRKVVDKVTATMQGTNIPQTPEKIDQYLSFSKPKLSKLVHAYVEKFQKS